jgi:glycerophosphoryl diester phosphodiesterase
MTYGALTSMDDSGSAPRLEDVLTTWPEMRLNIDLKDGPSVRAVAGALRRTSAVDRVCVTSFVDQRIIAIRRLLGPALCTGLGTMGVSLVRMMSAVPERLRPPRLRAGGAVLQIPVQFHGWDIVTPELVSYAHDVGLKVHVWTVNDADLMETMLDMHVDGIITDELMALKNLLMRRGLWRP